MRGVPQLWRDAFAAPCDRRPVRVVISLALLALLPIAARAEPAPDAKLRGELVTAINKRDVAGVTSRVSLPLHVSLLPFVDAACTRFTGKAEIDEANLAAFVGCLADLGVKNLTGPDDVFVNAVYGPGFPLALVGTPVRMAFGWTKAGATMYAIEPLTFSSHIKKFSRQVDPAVLTKKAIDVSATDHVEAVVTVCVDDKGKLKVLAKSDDPAYAQEVERVAAAWSITPFMLGEKAIEACTSLSVGYPASRISVPLQMRLPSPPPPPPPASPAVANPTGPQNVAPTLLEGSRIAGERVILPDDKTKTAITASKRDKVIGSFKLCLDTTGAITSVVALKSSGFPDYDAKIIREMNKWTYRPYHVDGKAVPVCTAVTFIYSQK